MSVFGKLQRVSNASCGCGFSHSAFIYFGVAPEKQERSIWSRSHLVRWTVPQRAVCSAGFLAIRSPAPGSFFVFEDGGVLSRQRLVTALTTALQEVGLDPSPYKGHSFCIGTATAAAKVGLSDFLIDFRPLEVLHIPVICQDIKGADLQGSYIVVLCLNSCTLYG